MPYSFKTTRAPELIWLEEETFYRNTTYHEHGGKIKKNPHYREPKAILPAKVFDTAGAPKYGQVSSINLPTLAKVILEINFTEFWAH